MPSDPELLDIFDDAGRPLGSKDRVAVHRDGDWHRVFHALVVRRPVDRPPSVLLQRRSPAKAAFPDLLDLSATGHLAAGESPLDGRRELAEELGVTVEADAFVPLGVRRIVEAGSEGKLNKELAHCFLLADNRPRAAYRPDPAEVSHVVEIEIDRLLDLFAGRSRAVPASFHPSDGAPDAVTVADFVPGEQYWITVLVMAQRFAADLTPLAI